MLPKRTPESASKEPTPKKERTSPPPLTSTSSTSSSAASNATAKTPAAAPAPVYVAIRLLNRIELSNTGAIYYLVQWEGYEDAENTWEPEANILNKKLIKRYQDDAKSGALGPQGNFSFANMAVGKKEEAFAQAKIKNQKKSNMVPKSILSQKITRNGLVLYEVDWADDSRSFEDFSQVETWKHMVVDFHEEVKRQYAAAKAVCTPLCLSLFLSCSLALSLLFSCSLSHALYFALS